jgi:hypothetical protein
MTTDKNSMVQEVRDPRAPQDATIPSAPTTKETMKTPVTNSMKGDIESAFNHLKKILVFLEKQDPKNDDMIVRAKKIRDHYLKAKTISEEQYEWIQAVVFSEPSTEDGFLPDPDEEPADAPTSPEEVARIVAERKKALKDQIKASAPPHDFQATIVQPKLEEQVTPDAPPSGEEGVGSEPEPESIVEEKPADPQPAE